MTITVMETIVINMIMNDMLMGLSSSTGERGRGGGGEVLGGAVEGGEVLGGAVEGGRGGGGHA